MLASVYAMYNNVFIMIKSILHGAIDAARLSFGQMLTERKSGRKRGMCLGSTSISLDARYLFFLLLPVR